MSAHRISPGLGWYWLAAALMVGGLVAPVSILLPMFRARPVAQFIGPSTNVVELKAGEYVFWNDHRTVFQGTTYASPSSLPNGVTMRLVSEPGNQAVPMASGFNATISSGSNARNSIGKFSVPAAGRYRMEISGESVPRVFSLREAQFSKVFRGIIMLIFVESVAWIGGPVIFIVVLLKRAKAKKQRA